MLDALDHVQDPKAWQKKQSGQNVRIISRRRGKKRRRHSRRK